MAAKSNEELAQYLALAEEKGGAAAAADFVGVPRSTMRGWCNLARKMGLSAIPTQFPPQDDWQSREPAFEYPELPPKEKSYEEVKASQIDHFERLKTHREAAKLIKVRVKLDGPYGVMVKGDPHLDNPGTDWPLLDRHIQIIKRTEGLFGANVGDLTDNWVGRLARLYANSHVSRSEAIVLIEGYLREVRWLWIDPGNHDLWSGADDPVQWITRFAGVHYKWQGSRLELVPPSGESVIVNSRHDHPGHSQYHPTHGPLKASIWDGFNDDIYTCGHIHSGGYMINPHNNGKISHIFRASSYKVYDDHKDERGFMERHLPAGVFIINPHAPGIGKITFFGDVEHGADVLTWMRRRYSQGKTVEVS